LEQIKKRIGTDFGCPTIEQAQAYVEELRQQSATFDVEISDGVKTLKEELGW
jgi:hypothetical protein